MNLQKFAIATTIILSVAAIQGPNAPSSGRNVNIQKQALIALTDSDENKRKKAVDMMGYMNDPTGLGVLAHILLNDTSDIVRREAADELGDLHHIYSIDALQKALKDDAYGISNVAKAALEMIKNKGKG